MITFVIFFLLQTANSHGLIIKLRPDNERCCLVTVRRRVVHRSRGQKSMYKIDKMRRWDTAAAEWRHVSVKPADSVIDVFSLRQRHDGRVYGDFQDVDAVVAKPRGRATRRPAAMSTMSVVHNRRQSADVKDDL